MSAPNKTGANDRPVTYTASADSLQQHRVPGWFRDAKFGIFIHWGPYSIPAFAPHHAQIGDVSGSGATQTFADVPYAEWYLNTMKFEDGATAAFHRETYGEDYSYDRFGEAFNASLENWDPVVWAKLFKRSGARYVVLVTKHHDGFLLWPSATPNPHKTNWGTKRDVVGELAAAARAEGLKFGVYYSGGIDWTFKDARIDSFADLMAMPGAAEGYIDYANAHYNELIERYEPDYLWNDIGYPSQQASFDILAKYYNTVPDGLTNDRWMAPDGEFSAEAFEKPDGLTGIIPPKPPVWDARTPEYGMFDRILPFQWETTRGLGHSFAFNRAETDSDYLSPSEIATMLASASCFNGNLLLNVGPRGDAQIDPAQAARLEATGDWLSKTGPAIQDTRAVALPQTSIGSINIGATRTPDALYIHILGKPSTGTLEVELPADVGAIETLRQIGGEVAGWSCDKNTLRVDVSAWADDAVQILELGLSCPEPEV